MVTAVRPARLLSWFCCAAVVAVAACTPKLPSPRERVLDFVRLVQSDSLANILPYIDLDSVASYQYSAARFDSLTTQQKKQKLVNGFIGDGEIRSTWTKSQIVVNEEQFLSDTTATVEVSFIERSSRIQYYSQFLVKKRPDGWVITNFKVN